MLRDKRARDGETKTKSEKPFPKIPPDRLLNGAVCASYARCSKQNCKCARGSLHGPYYHRYQWHNGRVIKQYIRLSEVEEVRAACARYRAVQNKLLAGRQRYMQMIATLKSQLRGFEL